MKRSVFLIWILALAGPEIFAQAPCSITLTTRSPRVGDSYVLMWNAVPNADTYVLEESTDNFKTTRRWEYVDKVPEALVKEVGYTSTVDLNVQYRVTASASSLSTFKPCSSTRDLVFTQTAWYRRAMQKSVIPLVGSTPGRNGAQFRTSLRLRATQDGQSGTLVLRRLNVPGSGSDPVLSYALAKKGDTVFYEDVVAAFGYTGLGSINIFPDETAPAGLTVPFAEVRLFNVGSGGTFGTIESQTQPFAWDETPAQPIDLVVPGPEQRLNFGVRSLESSLIWLRIYRQDQMIGTALINTFGNQLLFGSINEMTGLSLEPGDVVQVRGHGRYIPMYSRTDNATNDPELYIAPTKIVHDLTLFVLEQ